MSIKSSTLKPGLLVALSSTIRGNVRYFTKVIDAEHVVDSGAKKAKWETERTIVDPDDHEAAKKARGAARTAITRVCATSAFGLLCPEANADELEAGIAEARRIADAFNARSPLSRVSVNVLTGRIAADDVEAVKAINGEIRDLLEAMQTGLANLDTEAIREAAAKAKGLGSMLTPEANERVQTAVTVARQAANRIAKAGTSAALEVDAAAIRKVAAMRVAFLDDTDDAGEVAAPIVMGRAVVFEAADFATVAIEQTPAEKAWATRKAKEEAARLIAETTPEETAAFLEQIKATTQSRAVIIETEAA